MSFIKVTANQCNQQGNTDPHQPPTELHLNTDLIGAFQGDTILLKGGEIINLGGRLYKNFRLAQGAKIPTV